MSKGKFGVHGGQYIPETLMNAVIELEEAYNNIKMTLNLMQSLKDLTENIQADHHFSIMQSI